MSKRKNRSKSPNIPLETLERARRQAEGENVDEAVENNVEAVSEPRVERKQRTRSGSGAPTPVRARRRKQQTVEEMSHEEIEELLLNPTKTVSEEELHETYGYVLKDLRNMWILAAALFMILILLATVII